MKSETSTTLIILEDEQSHAEAIRRALKAYRYGCNIISVSTLREFDDVITHVTPDLVIADYILPDGNAFSLLQGDIESQVWPVLVMTSYGDEEIAVKALKMGALDYIVKSPEFFRNIERVISRNLREWRNIKKSRENERKYRMLFETMAQGVVYQNQHGTITEANPAVESIFGIPRNDIIHATYDHEQWNFVR